MWEWILSKEIPKGLVFQLLATLTGTSSIVCLGMHFGWPSPYIPQLLQDDSPIQMSSDDSSWVIILPCFGGVVGAIAASVYLDKIGRKGCMLTVSPVYLLSWLLISSNHSLELLYCARFLVGIADGIALTVFPVYICEIADPRIRGFLCSLMPIGILIGLLCINILGLFCTVTISSLISAVVPIVHFVAFFWIPESPYFLVLKNRLPAATASLKLFRGSDDVHKDLTILEQDVREETQSTGKLTDLVAVESNRRALFIVFLVRGVQQFSGYTAITFYTQTIFETAGGSVSSSTATIIYISVQLVVAAVSSTIVDRIGRRPLLMMSIIGSGITLAIEGSYIYLNLTKPNIVSSLGFIPLTALLLFIITFYIGLGTIPYIILGELFPTSIKAYAMCVADIYYSLIVALVSKLFHVMKDNFGMHIPFFSFSGCCLIGLFLVSYYVPETNRKTLEEIHDSLKTNSRKGKI